MVIISLFIFLIARGLQISAKAPDLFGRLIAIGVSSLIGLQVIGNLAVVSNTIPVTRNITSTF